MSHLTTDSLSLAEIGALALDAAARRLDGAHDTASFIEALELNQAVWRTLAQIALARAWQFPNGRQVAFALGGEDQGRASDQRVSALIDMNDEVSRVLAHGDELEGLREKASRLWARLDLPGGNLEQWLIAQLRRSSG